MASVDLVGLEECGMKFLISGSHGLIGSALVDSLIAKRHLVRCLVRHSSNLSDRDISWDPLTGEGDIEKFEGFDVGKSGSPADG